MFTAAGVSIQPVSRTCPTANCTFPTYNSLSVCPQVANVTHLLELLPWTSPKLTYLTDSFVVPDYMEHPVEAIYLPNDVWMPVSSIWPLSSQMPYYDNVVQANGTASLAFADLPNLHHVAITNFFILYQTALDDGSRIHDMSNSTYSFRAFEVLLHWCVNSYNTVVTDNEASTEVVRRPTSAYIPDDFAYLDLTVEGDGANYSITFEARAAVESFFEYNFENANYTTTLNEQVFVTESQFTSIGSESLFNALGRAVEPGPDIVPAEPWKAYRI